MFKKIFLFLSILFFLGNGIFAEIKIPEYHGYVNDYANLFSPQEEKILEDKISDLEKKSSAEIGILTIESLNGQPLFDYSMAVARGWGIGKKNKNNGLLILIAKKEHKIRIEVGYGLEGTITDAQAFWLIDDILKPKFRQQKYFQGVNEVLDRISEAILNGEKVPEKEKSWDSTTKVKIFLFGFISLILVYIASLWFYFRKHKIKNNFPEIIKEPYKNYHPFLTGYLIDKKMDNSDLMGGIIYLANKGYIEIQKKVEDGLIFDDKTYSFALKVSEKEVEDELDKLLIKLIFTSGFSKKIKKHGFYLKRSLDTLLDKADSVSSKKDKLRSWLKKYSRKHRLIENLDNLSWYKKFKNNNIMFILQILFWISAFGFIIMNPSLFYVFIILIAMLSAYTYRYTKKGWEIKYQLESFKEFLKNGELSDEEKTQEKFLEYLPYAYAFGVEKDWVKKFDNIGPPKWIKGVEKDFIKDLEYIYKIIAGIGTGFILTNSGIHYSAGSSSGSGLGVGFGGFGGGSFGGGGASGGW